MVRTLHMDDPVPFISSFSVGFSSLRGVGNHLEWNLASRIHPSQGTLSDIYKTETRFEMKEYLN